MKCFILFMALLSIITLSKVIELTDSNFDSAIRSYEYLLIEFYAPWCGHCKALAPEYEKAAEFLSKLDKPLYLAKVDCDANRSLTDRFAIEGFPALKLYKKGEYIDYNAGRKAEDIIAWYTKKAGPLSKELSTVNEAEQLSQKTNCLVVFFGNDNTLIDIFKKVADKFETFSFAHCSTEECQSQDKIVIYKKHDEGKVSLNESFTEDSLREFIQANVYPLVSEASDDVLTYIFENNKKVFFYFKEEGDNSFVDVIRSIAPAYKGIIYFITATKGEELTQHLTEYYSISEDKFPIIRITDVISDEKVIHYSHSGGFSFESVKNTIDDFLAGKLNPHIKSEPIPKVQRGVYKIVANTYHDLIINSDKNVLLKFYAPWCQHCEEIAPEYEKVFHAFSDVQNLLVAEIDATANDLAVEIEGYPTIKLYLAADKANPIDYQGERNFNGIREFLNQRLGLNVEDMGETQSSETKVHDDLSDNKEEKEEL
jgi:protein disulfide-isomerase A1